MNTKSFIITCVVLYVVAAVLGYVMHEMWLGATYDALADIWRPEAEMQDKQWIMFITGAVWVVIFTYMFVRGREGRGVMEGVRYGVLIGLFYHLTMAYDSYVVYPIPYTLALQWFIGGLITAVILGVVAALIYKPASTSI